MAVSKEKKSEILEGLIEDMKNAKTVVFSKYSGVSVLDMNLMRSKMREEGVKYKIAKKTLIRLAAKEIGIENIDDKSMEGPIAVALGMEDEIIVAKLVYEFAKKHEGLELLGSIFEGRALSVAETTQLACLPGKEELLTKIVYLLKSPIQGFHGVLNNTLAGFVRALNAIKEQKEKVA